jgi:hypothetical protein
MSASRGWIEHRVERPRRSPVHLKRTLQVRDLAARAHARAQAAARSAGHLEGTDLSLARLRQRKIPEAELDEYRAASGKDMSRVQSLQQQLYKAAKHRDDAKALQLEKGIGFRLRRDECIEKVPYQRTSGAFGNGAGGQGQPVTSAGAQSFLRLSTTQSPVRMIPTLKRQSMPLPAALRKAACPSLHPRLRAHGDPPTACDSAGVYSYFQHARTASWQR